jgi:heat shock protein HslJ
MRTHLLVQALSTLLLAACSNEDLTTRQLSGREFMLKETFSYSPASGTIIRLAFTTTEFSFNANCNSHSGAYTIAAGTLRVRGMSSTLMACAEDRMAQDDWLLDFFSSGPRITLDENKLTVTDGKATLIFLDRKVADPDRQLSGPVWTIDTFRTADMAMATSQLHATLAFTPDGTWRVDTGCNVGTGSYTASATQLTLSRTVFSTSTCSSQDTNSLVDHIAAVLADGTATYSIDATRLTIERGNRGISAVADQ